MSCSVLLSLALSSSFAACVFRRLTVPFESARFVNPVEQGKEVGFENNSDAEGDNEGSSCFRLFARVSLFLLFPSPKLTQVRTFLSHTVLAFTQVFTFLVLFVVPSSTTSALTPFARTFHFSSSFPPGTAAS